MNKAEKEKIKTVLVNNLNKADDAQFYFVKGLEEFSNAIVVKSKSVLISKNVPELIVLMRDELKNPQLDIFKWLDVVGDLIPKKNIYKVPFFDTKDIKEFNPWRVCPVGEHWVKRHDRQKTHLEDVDGHCRKNPSERDLIKGDEIEQISKTERFLKVPVSVSKKISDFESKEQFDTLISGWVAYWNDIFKVNPPLHPNYVKTLIASESGFDPKAFNPRNAKKIGAARGITQITELTQKQLSGEVKDLKDHFVILDGDEVYDPNKNICAATRWLFRKRETAKLRLKREASWEEVLLEYKGRTTSKTKKTLEVRETLKKYLDELREK